MNWDEIHPTWKQAVGTHEGFQRLGFRGAESLPCQRPFEFVTALKDKGIPIDLKLRKLNKDLN